MTNPRRYLTRMLIFVIAVAVIVVALWPTLHGAFMANTALNSLIISVLGLGIAYIFHQVWSLNREVNWIQSFRTGRPGMSVQASPRLLAPLAAMLGERGQKFRLVPPQFLDALRRQHLARAFEDNLPIFGSEPDTGIGKFVDQWSQF